MAASLLLLAFVTALLGGGVALASRQPGAPARPTPAVRLQAVRRRTLRWRQAGVLAGVAASAAAVALGDTLGRGLMLAAPLFALSVLLGVIAGELGVPAPGGPSRQVPLEVRRMRDYLPQPLVGAVTAAAALLASLLAVTTLSGSADDMGRAGRQLVRDCAGGVTSAVGPWPGSFYSLPLALVLLVGAGATLLALRRIVQRPRQGENLALDDLLRRQAAAGVTAAAGLLVAVPLAGVSGVTAIALLGHVCDPGWFAVAGTGLALVVPTMVALAGWCVVRLLATSAGADDARAGA